MAGDATINSVFIFLQCKSDQKNTKDIFVDKAVYDIRIQRQKVNCFIRVYSMQSDCSIRLYHEMTVLLEYINFSMTYRKGL